MTPVSEEIRGCVSQETGRYCQRDPILESPGTGLSLATCVASSAPLWVSVPSSLRLPFLECGLAVLYVWVLLGQGHG